MRAENVILDIYLFFFAAVVIIGRQTSVKIPHRDHMTFDIL
jgi:hypothetical protein